MILSSSTNIDCEHNNHNGIKQQFCNNCGKHGHTYNKCKVPITSIGIIAYRVNKSTIEYLMICRKHTLGFIDFMRGKYLLTNKDYILNMFTQMTNAEKTKIGTMRFDQLWTYIWGKETVYAQYKVEENASKHKFNLLSNGVQTKHETYNLLSIIEESNTRDCWEVPEWGFPKGRRNYMEKDYNCAIREFMEETGYNSSILEKVNNILPFEEIFTGSNYKSYKHKYYLTHIKYEDSFNPITGLNNVSGEMSYEISTMEWKTYEDCVASIRPYNLEKLRIIGNINALLTNYIIGV